MSKTVRQTYASLCVVENDGVFQLYEDGVLLASADKINMCYKLFFKRALDIASARVAAGESARVAMTALGKERFMLGR